ncbi:alpha/beta hydrolase [Streptomyces atriruber]|uniref:Alpha/beta hydrolase n=1 Tax=Streptomyces atriruber TaxID=545121 RepID=A0ABV3BLV9_9ACTN
MNRAGLQRRRPFRLGLATLAAVTLAGCTTGGAGGEAAGNRRPGLERFYGQKLAWKACGELRCARLTVPRDYAHPENGKTFVLPVAKAVADEPAPAGAGRRAARGARSAENDDEAIVAVSCLNVPHPRTAGRYWQALGAAERTAGVYGTSSVVDELPCKNWPAGTARPHRVEADGVPPVLVVGTTGDPATPYKEARSLAAQLPGGMLLTYEGLGHTAYGRSNACVEDAVDAYLIDLKRVRAETTC